jgi:hypothetical protein
MAVLLQTPVTDIPPVAGTRTPLAVEMAVTKFRKRLSRVERPNRTPGLRRRSADRPYDEHNSLDQNLADRGHYCRGCMP